MVSQGAEVTQFSPGRPDSPRLSLGFSTWALPIWWAGKVFVEGAVIVGYLSVFLASSPLNARSTSFPSPIVTAATICDLATCPHTSSGYEPLFQQIPQPLPSGGGGTASFNSSNWLYQGAFPGSLPPLAEPNLSYPTPQ